MAPFTLIGLTFVFFQLVAVYVGGSFSLILAGILALLLGTSFLCSVRKRGGTVLLCLFVGIISLLYSGTHLLYHVEPLRVYDEQKVELVGSVKEVPYTQDGKYYYLLRVEKFTPEDGEEVHRNFDVRLVSSASLGLELYQEVSGGVKLYAPEDSMGYSSQKYNQAKGIAFYAYPLENFSATGEVRKKDLMYWAQEGNRWTQNRIEQIFPGDIAALIQGILLGDKRDLPDEVRYGFDFCGIQHLMAVSGLHITFFGQILIRILKALRVRYRWRNLLAIFGVWAFAAVVGFPVSAVRASIMSSIYFLGNVTFREDDFLNSLGISGFLLGVLHPLCAGDLGFQMSFLSILAISFANYQLDVWQSKRPNDLWFRYLKIPMMTLSVTLFLLPVSALAFGSASAVSVIANILIMVPTQILLTFAFFAVVLYGIPILEIGGQLCTFLANCLAEYILAVTRWLSNMSMGKIPLTEPTMLLWIVLTLLFVAAALFFCKGKFPARTVVLCGAGTFVAAVLLVGIQNYNNVSIGVIQREDAVAVSITERGETSVFFFGDGGQIDDACEDYFAGHGLTRMNTWILSEDVAGKSIASLSKLMKFYSPKAIIFENGEYFPAELSENLPKECEQVCSPALKSIDFSDRVRVSRISSEEGAWFLISLGDSKRVIVAAGAADGKDLPEQLRQSDVLIANTLPKGTEGLYSEVLLVAAEEQDCKKMLPQSISLAKYIYTTAENDEFTLIFRGDQMMIRKG